MGNVIDLTGSRFGRLVVLERDGSLRGEAAWLCQCDCGRQKTTRGFSLRNGDTTSCGCVQRERTSAANKVHGRRQYVPGTPKTYASWVAMRRRCTEPGNNRYHMYGGRGITVCERWANSFENFLADMGERPDGMTLDRIDVNGNYEQANCKWSTATEQARNRRTSK